MSAPIDILTAAHLRNLHDEEVGVRHRIQHYYLPLFLDYCRTRGLRPAEVRVLDCGCGNGLSVEQLAEAGFSAYGVDIWNIRQKQWVERCQHPRSGFCSADAGWLPFRDACFDIVMSCGLLEHIGVSEEGHPRYRVTPRPDLVASRQQFISECLRVLRGNGVLYLDHPNGAFPIDFWHNNHRSRPRVHLPSEQFLPKFKEVRALAQRVERACIVEAISPARRFTFRRSRRRWYGKMFNSAVEKYFELLRQPHFAWLASSFLNPYLVIRIKRHQEVAPRD